MRKLLLIEPDEMTAGLLASLLDQHGFETHLAATAAEGLRRLESDTQAILVAAELQDEDGYALVRRLRDHGERRPILMLSESPDDDHYIRGLNVGADDYAVKPVNYLALVARVEALLRRMAWQAPAVARGDGLDADQRVLRLGGKVAHLTLTEFRLLEVLTGRPGRTFSRAELWERIDADGSAESLDRAIDLHVARLRQKVEADPKEPRHLLTVRGVGYRFDW